MKKHYFNREKLQNTYFSIFKKPVTNITDTDQLNIFDVYDLIKESYVESTFQLRQATDKSKVATLKRTNFHSVTFSGVFSTRNDNALVKHSNLICIDIDGLLKIKMNRVRKLLRSDPYLILFFVSPSGTGLKVVFPVDIDYMKHEDWYKLYAKHLIDFYHLPAGAIDMSCKNLSRPCFICHDSEVFLNPAIENGDDIYPINPDEQENLQISDESYETLNFDYNIGFDLPNRNAEQNFMMLMKETEIKIGAFRKGQRHNWIVSLAGRCNVFGMEMNVCKKYILKYFSNHPQSVLPEDVINVKYDLENPVMSIYEQHKDQFNTQFNISESAIEKEDDNTRLFPEDIYATMPNYVADLCNQFNGRDRDVFLVSLLGVSSCCFPKVTGIYDEYRFNSNLYFFITAPASAGKSPMRWARALINPIDKHIKEVSRELIENYKVSLADYKNGIGDHPGRKPKFQSLLISANNSSTGILQNVADNDEVGLIFETEADTLSTTLSKDWGNFSDFLRQAFQHEPFSYNRRSSDEYVEVESPKLSVVLSGTPQQVKNLVSNTENGLFSRFAFYAFNLNAKWKNVFERKNKTGRQDYFNEQATMMFDYYQKAENMSPVSFILTEPQEARFNLLFDKVHTEFTNLVGHEIIPTVRRLGLITFRIAMLFTIFRNLEKHEPENEWICTDDDFNNALAITDVLKDHAAFVYQSYKDNTQIDLKPKPLQFYQLLPASFERAEYIEIAKQIDIIPKTAESYINKFITKNYLKRQHHNHYAKCLS